MLRTIRPIFAFLILLALCPFVLADLQADMKAVLADKMLRRATVGVAAVELLPDGQSRSIYRLNDRTPLIPASNFKIVTTAAALDGLGADFKFRTVLLQRGEDLAIVGDGDPTLGDWDLLRKVGWDVTTVFEQWAAGLAARGVKSIRNVYVDDSIFDEEFFHPNWPVDQMQYRYVAQVGGLSLNLNCIGIRLGRDGAGNLVIPSFLPATRYVTVRNTCVGGNRNAVATSRQSGTNIIDLQGEIDQSVESPLFVTIHDPPMFVATVLAETFGGRGVPLTGTVTRDRTLRTKMLVPAENETPWQVLAIHETSIESVLARANKDSVNLYAESLCKRLGAQKSGESGSWANGLRAIDAYLQRAGVPADQYTLDDGCGLSRANRMSPDGIVKVLASTYRSENSHLYLTTLAVAGVDGTLDDRFRGTDLQQRVFAKSGFINEVSSLSGFLRTKDNRWVAFSILINGIPDKSNWQIKQLQERIVSALDRRVS